MGGESPRVQCAYAATRAHDDDVGDELHAVGKGSRAIVERDRQQPAGSGKATLKPGGELGAPLVYVDKHELHSLGLGTSCCRPHDVHSSSAGTAPCCPEEEHDGLARVGSNDNLSTPGEWKLDRRR